MSEAIILAQYGVLDGSTSCDCGATSGATSAKDYGSTPVAPISDHEKPSRVSYPEAPFRNQG